MPSRSAPESVSIGAQSDEISEVRRYAGHVDDRAVQPPDEKYPATTYAA